jgi:flavin reductase (DIM6/NTAB) family NADH-FMN oxidoreductase RutF
MRCKKSRKPILKTFMNLMWQDLLGDYVKPMRVKESPINIECWLEQIIPLGNDNFIIGRVVNDHIVTYFYLGNY